MEEINTNTPAGRELIHRLQWVQRISNLMDEKFRFPGTNFRFGLDPLLNLIPVAGDLSGFLISAVLVITMAQHGASRKLIILMTLNILLDLTIGAIPIIGQVFDFFFKANKRNIRLLRDHYERGKYQGRGTGTLILVLIIFIGLFTSFILIIWKTIEWLIGLF
jgi:hypothetical protein